MSSSDRSSFYVNEDVNGVRFDVSEIGPPRRDHIWSTTTRLWRARVQLAGASAVRRMHTSAISSARTRISASPSRF